MTGHDFTPGQLIDPDDPIWTELEDETGEMVDAIDWLEGLGVTGGIKALNIARFYCGDDLNTLTPFGNQEMEVMCWTIRELARQVEGV
jgi:hypothetical protein